MNIQLVPRVCSGLMDQSHCAKAVEMCGANMIPEACSSKLIFMNLTYGSVNDFPSCSKFVMGVGNKVFQFGQWYVHSLISETHAWWITIPKEMIQQ